MPLSTKQRNALPASAFIDRKRRRFPVPTKAQARRAGISEAQRVRTLRNALSRAGQSQPRRQAVGKGGRKVAVKTVTPSIARRAVKSRGAGTVASVKRGAARRTTTRRKSTRRRRSR